MATTDLRDTVGKNRPQSSRRIEIPNVIDFAANNFGAGDSVPFRTTPKGFVLEDIHPIGLVAEGGVATVDVGDADDPDGLLDGVSVNATGKLAKAGTEAYTAGLPMSEKVLLIKANNALDAAKVNLILIGYIDDHIS